MNEFVKLLKTEGMEDSKHFIDFIDQLIEDPEIFYSLSNEKRAEMEKKFDQALQLFEEAMNEQ